jgi:hypothetical protein
MFGLPCDPVGVSEPLQSLSIYGRLLSANGIPFAVYEPKQEMWHGAGTHTWWHAFRVECAELRQLIAARPTSRGHVIELPQAPEDPGHESSLS